MLTFSILQIFYLNFTLVFTKTNHIRNHQNPLASPFYEKAFLTFFFVSQTRLTLIIRLGFPQKKSVNEVLSKDTPYILFHLTPPLKLGQKKE